MYKYIFWDLDGTITQSEFGILNSVKYALDNMGIKDYDMEKLKVFIGPPLIDSFQNNFNMDEESAVRAVELYRECYKAGEVYNCPLYDGVKETIKALYEKGYKQYVVTSKPLHFAKIIVEYHGLLDYFEDVIGPGLGIATYTKIDYMRDTIKLTVGGDLSKANLSEYVMVGDRKFDIEAANANKIDSVGVLYGYGSRKELETEGATYIIEKPGDLLDLV